MHCLSPYCPSVLLKQYALLDQVQLEQYTLKLLQCPHALLLDPYALLE
jgi:hypothetical protein